MLNISATTGQILLKFEMQAYRTKLNVIETLKEDDLSWKMTPCGRRTQKLKTWNISATVGLTLLKYEIKAYRTKPNVIETLNEDELSWKMTPCGRRPQKIKLRISQQLLV